MKRPSLFTLVTLCILTSISWKFATIHSSGLYKEITIGKQVWMTTNLNVDKFRNGDPIPQAKTDQEWQKAGYSKQPAWCYYNNDSANGDKFGKLYNWYAVNDPRGLAPAGWHVPDDSEWAALMEYLEGEKKEKTAGSKLKSKTGWKDNGNGSNASGFTALPAGTRSYMGPFNSFGGASVWWSGTESNVSKLQGAYTGAWGYSVNYHNNFFDRKSYNKIDGKSVRCVKN